MTLELPDYNPNLLATQIAINDEMRKRELITEEEYQRRDTFIHDEDHRKRAKFIEVGYQKFDIPKMEEEFHTAMAREQRQKASHSNLWLYSWNLEPQEDPFALVSWQDNTEQERAKHRRQATPHFPTLHPGSVQPLDWLWPERLPLGKLSLLTGDAGDGKSLVATDLIARVTAGRDWPDGTAATGPGEVLLITSEAGLYDVISPRLIAAEADLSRLHPLSAVGWNDPKTGEPARETFQLPMDGPLLEKVLEQRSHLRLVVFDPLSEFLSLPPAAREREFALHDVLSDLAELAEVHQLAILCVETARRGGLIGTASHRQWRAHYDAAFQTVWGIARDPRDRSRRLLLPIRHHLGNDQNGQQFTIEPSACGTAHIAWGAPEDSITYAEATGRVRLGRSVWSFSQTADAETWLREYLRDGEKSSVDIFSEAREQGFTEFPLRCALRRVAHKNKQGDGGAWSWRLRENGQNSRVSG